MTFCEECKHLPNCELAKHEEVDTCKKGESMTDTNYDEENINDVLEQIKEIREETAKDGKVLLFGKSIGEPNGSNAKR